MPINLSGRPFLRLLDFSTEEIDYLLKLSKNFKDLKRTGTPHRYLEGKNIVLLFQKTSTRTRCAFEVGAMDLGMGVTYLDPGSSQMGKKESIEDTARVLGRFYDGIEFRGFAQTDVEDLAANAGVPVWNGLTTEWHPTQMLADILTVQENFNYDIKGKTLVFMGDAANNVARSLMVVCSKLGMNFVACGPKENMPDAELIETCTAIAAENGCTVKCTDDVAEACTGAHVIYTDVWVSMGEPDEVWEQRIKQLWSMSVHLPRKTACLLCKPAEGSRHAAPILFSFRAHLLPPSRTEVPLQPGVAVLDPDGAGHGDVPGLIRGKGGVVGQGLAVAAVGVDARLHVHAPGLQRLGQQQGVLHGDTGVVGSVPEKKGRRAAPDPFFQRNYLRQLLLPVP